MQQIVSKSQFKPQVLEYLRIVEKLKKPLIITHAGKPVVKVVPYSETAKDALQALRNSVIEFKQPTKPLKEEWESLK